MLFLSNPLKGAFGRLFSFHSGLSSGIKACDLETRIEKEGVTFSSLSY